MIKAFFLALGIFLLPPSSIRAQNAMDHENIFSLFHTRIGIPEGDKLRIYAPKKQDWELLDSITLPKNYLGIDGNIRRVYILMENKMEFHGFYGERKDYLMFNDSINMNGTSHWIRTPYTTEKDIWIYKNERIITYVKDGETWFKIGVREPISHIPNNEDTVPLIKGDNALSFKKLYSFENEAGEYVAAIYTHHVNFHRYELPKIYLEALKIDFMEKYQYSLPSPKEMKFILPEEAITAFVYDRQMIAVVFPIFIRFYKFNFGQKKWVQNSEIPDLTIKL